MAPGVDAAMASRVKTLWETGDMDTVLAKLQGSGSIYFHKLLGWSHNCKAGRIMQLAMPVRFIEEHGDKFEEWAILRTQSSSKPWRVRLSVFLKPTGSPQVRVYGGWKRFVVENGLKEGDSLVFVLNEDARSEFQVYIFLGTGRFARRSSSACRAPARNSCNDSADGTKFSEQTGKTSYVDGDKPYAVGRNIRKSGDLLIGKKAVQERQQNVQDRRSSEVFSEALTGRECKGRASQHGTNLQFPSFCRRLYVHNLGQGHMIEVPASFVRTHEMQFQDAVELQGIHQESPVRTVTCHWVRSGEQQLRLYFKGGWRNFAKENGLIKGQELQFSLTSKSFFVVRVVCGTSN